MPDRLQGARRFVIAVTLLAVIWFTVSVVLVLTSHPYWPLGRIIASAAAATLSTLERWALWLGAVLIVAGLELLTDVTLASLFE